MDNTLNYLLPDGKKTGAVTGTLGAAYSISGKWDSKESPPQRDAMLRKGELFMQQADIEIDTIKVAYISSGSGDIRDLFKRLIKFYETHSNIITQDIQFLGTDAAKVFYAEHS